MIKSLRNKYYYILLDNNKYRIIENNSNTFIIEMDENTKILFEAFGSEGALNFKIKSIITKKRIFQAQRFFYKYILFIREVSSVLLFNNVLWDCKQNEPLWDVREKNGYNKNLSDISKSYFNKIIEI